MTNQAMVVSENGVVAMADAPPPAVLFRSHDPAQIVAQASMLAKALAPVIDDRQLYTLLNNRKHIRVEGWTLLGTMLGVFPICVWSRAVENGWEARVEARTMSGAVVGAAESACLRDEPNWRDKPDYALRSMAQTRATSKALRLPLGFVMAIAGYDATPAEEMDGIDHGRVERAGGTRGRQDNAGGNVAGRPVLPATEPQIKACYAIARGAQGMDSAEVDARCQELYGVTPSGLTRAQASDFIDVLKGARPAPETAPATVIEGTARTLPGEAAGKRIHSDNLATLRQTAPDKGFSAADLLATARAQFGTVTALETLTPDQGRALWSWLKQQPDVPKGPGVDDGVFEETDADD